MNAYYFCNQNNFKNGLGFCLLGPDFVLRVDMGDDWLVREFKNKKRKGNQLSKTLGTINFSCVYSLFSKLIKGV